MNKTILFQDRDETITKGWWNPINLKLNGVYMYCTDTTKSYYECRFNGYSMVTCFGWSIMYDEKTKSYREGEETVVELYEVLRDSRILTKDNPSLNINEIYAVNPHSIGNEIGLTPLVYTGDTFQPDANSDCGDYYIFKKQPNGDYLFHDDGGDTYSQDEIITEVYKIDTINLVENNRNGKK